MAAQALYLKYRPQTFEEVVGQQAVTRTLRNALRQGRVRHAYLFTGPRGTGKTTTARLLAKAVNCQAPDEQRPCNQCAICQAVNEGRLLDLIEIDAASNRGIDEIRDIREKVGFRPNEGRFKVYVLDEAHMLTEPAFNALLKTLEEPPPHIIFILVTTDPHKIPATITSRCQRFDFRRIPLDAIVDRLAAIAEQEGIAIELAGLELIAQQGTGAMRDAISLLDQLASYGAEITLEQVQMVLGAASSEAARRLVACLAEGDEAGGLDVLNQAINDGADPRQFGRGVVEVLRSLLLIKKGAGARVTLNTTAEQAAELEALAARMPLERLLRAICLFNAAVTEVKSGLQVIPQLPLEMALVESNLEPVAAPPAERVLGAPTAPHTVKEYPAAELSAGAPVLPPMPGVQPAPEAEAAVPMASGPQGGTSPAPLASSAPDPTPALLSPASAPPSPSPGGGLSLGQVQGAWDRVLQLVRQRNPTTQGVLNTGCKAAEVNGSEIVITFPFPFLREKLRDPQRLKEIQDALSDVFEVNCTVKLVLASEFQPSQPSAGSKPLAVEGQPAQASSPAPAAMPGQGGATPGAPQAAEQAAAVPSEIDQWAAQHGAQARVLPF